MVSRPRFRSGRPAPLTTAILVVAACFAARPAEAQRLGRRARSAPAPARQPLPPARPRPAAESPRGSDATPRATPPRTPTPAEKPPQTTKAADDRTGPAVEPTDAQRAAEVAWGVVPFSPAWRAIHPAAWTPDDDEPTVRLVGAEEPTTAEGDDGVAPRAAAERSVLVRGVEEPAPLLFPEDRAAAPASPEVAADGTVSVLAREPGAAPASPAPRGATATVGLDDAKGSPWLALGTFAAVPSGSGDDTVPHVFLELSLHRDGRVRGNYFDALANAVQPVSGRLDRGTGTVSWRVARGPEFTTSAEGLTSGRAEVLIGAAGRERSWTLLGLR